MKRTRKKYNKIFIGDFETTYDKDGDMAFVWLSALADIRSKDDDVVIFRNVQDTLDYLSQWQSTLTYYHNLKFDGSFILSYILDRYDFIEYFSDDPKEEQPLNTYSYIISDMGMWYEIKINYYGRILEFYDSYKILPFSVDKIGQAFNTKQKKLVGSIDYSIYRDEFWEPTEIELEYIKHDVLVVKEALWPVIKGKQPRMTIGSYCLHEFKQISNIDKNKVICPLYGYDEAFPDLSKMTLDKDLYGSSTYDEYIRKAYHGGYCYLVKGKENKVFHNGVVVDVNSLYPSVMHSISGNVYPLSVPVFFKCEPNCKEIKYNEEMYDLYHEGTFYYVRFKCRFELKAGMLPTIQIKGNRLYRSNEWLDTSDFKIKGKRYKRYIDLAGNVIEARPELTMSCTDYNLLNRHYDIYDLEILDFCVFTARKGIFDEYIDKYRKIKEESTGPQRTLAKLYLNNLYGKMATSPINIMKRVTLDSTKELIYNDERLDDKSAGDIAVGAAITSYARYFTITAAQQNYYGPDNAGFIYADTDSLHCDISIDDIKGINIDDKAFLCWKHESSFDDGLYVRQKTYLERSGDNYDIKCAGMGSGAKDNFEKQLKSGEKSITDYKVGLTVDGKKVSHRAKGGIAIIDTSFVMR